MAKQKWVSVTATFYLKGADRKEPGIRHEGWNFGKERPVELWRLMAMLCKALVEFYANSTGASLSVVNEQIKLFSTEIASWKMNEQEDEVLAPDGAIQEAE